MLFGLTSTYWQEVLAAITDRDDVAFIQVIMLYVEKFAQITNLQDYILRWVSKWKKPFVLDRKEFICRCKELYSFANIQYTRVSIPIPTDEQKYTNPFLCDVQATPRRLRKDV